MHRHLSVWHTPLQLRERWALLWRSVCESDCSRVVAKKRFHFGIKKAQLILLKVEQSAGQNPIRKLWGVNLHFRAYKWNVKDLDLRSLNAT